VGSLRGCWDGLRGSDDEGGVGRVRSGGEEKRRKDYF
jgi:hypothetical protein